MAFNGGPAVSEQVEMVVQVTQADFQDHAKIENALKSNHGNIETVINEYLDDVEKVCATFFPASSGAARRR
jgi:hypothetical protein